MRAVVGRMPLWARGENAEIETAMLTDSRAAEYREVAGAEPNPKGLKVAGADETEGAEPQGKNKNPDGAD
jgi:hypothetical protein